MIDISTDCIGGMTNNTYMFEYDGDQFILRTPGKRTSDYIDRKAEAYNANFAYDCGLGPEVIYCDGVRGRMVTRFIHSAKTLAKHDLKCPVILRRVVETIKKLHDNGPVLSGHFDPFRTINDYVKYLKIRGSETTREYNTALCKAQSIRDVLGSNSGRFTACHIDTQPENFLDTGERIFLIDWEYAGNGDAFWDLATLSIEAEFDSNDEKSMLEIYLGETPCKADLGWIYIYKIVCDLVWAPWAVIQEINGNTKIDYRSYGLQRCSRALSKMQQSEFDCQLRNVRSNRR